MKNSPDPLSAHEEDSVTYVEGLGFVPSQNGKPLSAQIRKMSNVICLILVSYFFFQRILTLPMAYFADFIGVEVDIDRLAGQITAAEPERLAVSTLTNTAAILPVLLLLAWIYRRALAVAGSFKRAHRGTSMIAIPILVAVGVLSMALGSLFEEFSGFFGLIFDSLPPSVSEVTPLVLFSFFTTLGLVLLQELLFRGIILAPLRRFGDEFAVLATAVLSALWSAGPIHAVFEFLFGLCAGYFVIRSGSVWTSFFSRLLLEGILFGFQCAAGMLTPQTAALVLISVCLLLLLLAMTAFIRFIRRDENAFRLLPAQGTMRTHTRLALFCSSLAFLLLLLSMAAKIVHIIQIIGW